MSEAGETGLSLNFVGNHKDRFCRVPAHMFMKSFTPVFEPWLEISNSVVCATSNASDQPAHTRRLIRAFASRLHIL